MVSQAPSSSSPTPQSGQIFLSHMGSWCDSVLPSAYTTSHNTAHSSSARTNTRKAKHDSFRNSISPNASSASMGHKCDPRMSLSHVGAWCDNTTLLSPHFSSLSWSTALQTHLHPYRRPQIQSALEQHPYTEQTSTQRHPYRPTHEHNHRGSRPSPLPRWLAETSGHEPWRWRLQTYETKCVSSAQLPNSL